MDVEDDKQEAGSPQAGGFCSPVDRGSPFEAVRPCARCWEGVSKGLGMSKWGWGVAAEEHGAQRCMRASASSVKEMDLGGQVGTLCYLELTRMK